MSIKIHITGAPGSGKTTIGSALAKQLYVRHIDADMSAWKVTELPYQKRVGVDRRIEIVADEIKSHASWVLTGSIYGWGFDIYRLCSLVVLVLTPTDIRIKRLRVREFDKFGVRIKVGGDLYTTHSEFINKAKSYDEGSASVRSLARDVEWLVTLPCSYLQIDGRDSLHIITKKIISDIWTPSNRFINQLKESEV